MKAEIYGPLGSSRYASYVADIHESGAHLLKIINDILDLSKSEAGRLQVQDSEFDLAVSPRAVCACFGRRPRPAGCACPSPARPRRRPPP